jgi:aspartate ammonia-lyase
MGGRIEQDSLGPLEVPSGALYGIQTERALQNFPISGQGPHPDLVWATVIVKKAAALANLRTGRLAEELARAIVSAADEILGEGRWLDQFVVDRFQAGAGTSHNMNANELLANRANELLGGSRGSYRPVHPNDHVNMSQSSNDAFPTMTRLALLRGWERSRTALILLAGTLAAKEVEFSQAVKPGRTHLQDAVPIRLGQEFGAYRATVHKAIAAVDSASAELKRMNLGATAVGTGMNATAEYRKEVVAELRELTGWDLAAPADYFQVTQSADDFVRFSGAIRALAVELAKLADDLRLLSSGPRFGLGDVRLPAVQPGSSIMPGKVNPVMAEMLDMVCFQVIGNDLAVSLAGMHGQLDLNVFVPLIANLLPTSLGLLDNAVRAFAERCVAGISADPVRLADSVRRDIALATALAPLVGYEKAAAVAKRAAQEGITVREAALAEGILDAPTIDRALDLGRLTEPGLA